MKTKQQESIGRAMELVKQAQQIVWETEFTQKQNNSIIFSNHYWNTKNNLEKCFGQLSRLWDMSAEKPMIEI